MTGTGGDRLLISYEATTPSLFSLRGATQDLCEVVWLLDGTEPDMEETARLLSRMGTVVDMGGRSPAQVAQMLGAAEPTGVVALNDRRINLLAELAESLGLVFHTQEVARRLSDKLLQRQAMEAAGLPTPPFVEIPDGLTLHQAERLARTAAYPGVLKPRSGDGSREVHHVHDASQVASLVAAAGHRPEQGGWILEGYLEGSSRSVSRFADVVSVETFVTDGEVVPLAVTGRFPFADPHRETGSVLPSDLGPSDVLAAHAAASAAVVALGIEHGCQHTELKFTPDGPVVVEVNGRIGGGVSELMVLAGCDLSLLRFTMELALGNPPSLVLPLQFPKVAYRRIAPPPVGARRVVEMVGEGCLQDIPGVEEVHVNRRPGDTVDWRLGLGQYIFSVYGSADDYDGVDRARRLIDRSVRVSYDRDGLGPDDSSTRPREPNPRSAMSTTGRATNRRRWEPRARRPDRDGRRRARTGSGPLRWRRA
jgi:biotin carboxylase